MGEKSGILSALLPLTHVRRGGREERRFPPFLLFVSWDGDSLPPYLVFPVLPRKILNSRRDERKGVCCIARISAKGAKVLISSSSRVRASSKSSRQARATKQSLFSDKGHFPALATILSAWLEIGKLFYHWFLFAFHFYQPLVHKHQRSQWTERALIGPQFPAFLVAGRESLS
jgi:hypothetical protein